MDETPQTTWPRVRSDSMQPTNSLSHQTLAGENFGETSAAGSPISQKTDEASNGLLVPREQCNDPLLRLPAELRNNIYKLVLGGKKYKFKSTFACKHARLDMKEKNMLGLLYVCRQIHSETALLPYTLNTFSFRDLDISFYPFFKQRSPAQVRSLRSIELVTYKAEQMWADHEMFSQNFADEIRVLDPFPNLKHIRIIIDTHETLYPDVRAHRKPNWKAVRDNMITLEYVIHQHRPDIIVTFWEY